MWPDIGTAVNTPLTDLVPVRVLYELDGPMIFTCHDVHGDLLLAYMCDEGPSLSRFLLVPFDEQLEHRLTNGNITIREAIEQPRIWMADVNNDWTITGLRRVKIDQVPIDHLPQRGTMLWPSLQPLLSLRAIGKGATEVDVLGSVIAKTIGRAEEALKTLIEYAADGLGIGRALQKQLYDLPTQRMAFGSFEVSFRAIAPDAIKDSSLTVEQVNAVYAKVSEMLRTGLEIATKDHPVAADVGTEEGEQVAILKATKALAPAPRDAIDEIQVSGTLARRSEKYAARLGKRTNKNAKKIIDVLTEPEDEETKPIDRNVQFNGRIIQITDSKPYQFVLGRTDGTTANFELSEENERLWRDVAEAIKKHFDVTVSAEPEQRGAYWFAIAVHKASHMSGQETPLTPPPSGD